MLSRKSFTKRALLARLLHGPFSLERDGLVLRYRLTLPDDDERKHAVVITLAPEYGFLLQEYDHDSAYADLNGKAIRLTRAEADAVATLLRRTLWIHAETPEAKRLRRQLRPFAGLRGGTKGRRTRS